MNERKKELKSELWYEGRARREEEHLLSLPTRET